MRTDKSRSAGHQREHLVAEQHQKPRSLSCGSACGQEAFPRPLNPEFAMKRFTRANTGGAYASQIRCPAESRRRGACRKARREVEELSQGRVEIDGVIDERKGTQE